MFRNPAAHLHKQDCESTPFSRYASQEMVGIFSSRQRAYLFRKLWLALAKAQQSLGLPISDEQIDEMQIHIEEIDFEAIQSYESRFRHDVMAHLYAFGDLCPQAKPILHLGATSTFVTDNGDLIQLREGLALLFQKLVVFLRKLEDLARTHQHAPCVGYTHYQKAQPTTIGKRVCIWIQDFLIDALNWEKQLQQIPFLGAKGATGTQASFLSLFSGDETKVGQLEDLLAREFGFLKTLSICGQTYSRKLDLSIAQSLASFAASIHKMATDLRLLAHDGEISESFSSTQVGSSAMPYKRNPIYSERLCGIARFVISLEQNAAYTLALQWLERSLDDSSNRRLTLSSLFLATDALLNIGISLCSSLEVFTNTSLDILKSALPLLAMENILMEAVKKGGDRQGLHEKLKGLISSSDFIEKISQDPSFSLSREEVLSQLDISRLLGRAPQQVQAFFSQELNPFLARHKELNPSIPSLTN